MATAYRFGIFDMEQLVLLDGHLVYHEPTVSFCLWSYDYDVDSTSYSVDGYIEFKCPMTVEEVMALSFFAEHGCICFSPASVDDPAPLHRSEECHDLSAFMEPDDLPEGMLYSWTLPTISNSF